MSTDIQEFRRKQTEFALYLICQQNDRNHRENTQKTVLKIFDLAADSDTDSDTWANSIRAEL